MYYEINVSKNGTHYFATHERSLRTFADCVDVYAALKKAFPAEQGYKVSASQRIESGKFMTDEIERFLNADSVSA